MQTLRQFPKEELFGKVVMVRFESNILRMKKQDQHAPVVIRALSTIKYLYESGAKIILVGNWSVTINSKILTVESVAGMFCRTVPASHLIVLSNVKLEIYCRKYACF